MMMVMAVMAEALHLLPNYGQTPFCVKLYLLRFTQGFASRSDTIRDANVPKDQLFRRRGRLVQQIVYALIKPIAQIESIESRDHVAYLQFDTGR
jgi:hypothetical protein